jgi:hypothetical protein
VLIGGGPILPSMFGEASLLMAEPNAVCEFILVAIEPVR